MTRTRRLSVNRWAFKRAAAKIAKSRAPTRTAARSVGFRLAGG
jgi:hypothetical protein